MRRDYYAVLGTSAELGVPRFSPCTACGARGRVEGRACDVCSGRGVRRVPERVTITIPAGVDSGMQVRVPGQGSAGPFGGPRGDLLVSTRVLEHPFFIRKGEGIHCDLPISVWEALRGARIRVPTPQGEAVLVVPPATQAGQVFRLRGQGVPRPGDDAPGDLFVTVRGDVPGGLDARSDELVRELARLLRLTRDLGVNLAGVEIILKMRRRMIDMQKQIEDLVAYVRDSGAGEARPERGGAPREALVRAASGQLGPVDLF